jgi:hypothetical protein
LTPRPTPTTSRVQVILHAVETSLTGNVQTTGGPATTFDQFGPDNYPGTTSVTSVGSGLTSVTLSPTSVDPTFFVTPVSSASFNTSLVDPFLQVDPSAQFDALPNNGGFVTPHIGVINGSSGPDWQLQADGNMSFTAIPEPDNLALIVLVGLVLWAGASSRTARGLLTARQSDISGDSRS